MEKKQEAEQAWRNFNKEKSSYEYTKAPLQSVDDAEYIQAVSYNSRQYGIEDFKLALKAGIEKEAKKRVSKRNASEANKYLVFTANDILSLIDEVKPIQK